MIKSEKKLAELGKALEGGKSSEIEVIINHLRNTEPFEGALLLLAQFYDTKADESLKAVISGFFNDIKEKSARNEVIESAELVTGQSTKAMIVASCWQSGLDYSDHSVSLGNIFINGDYMTSLECFTVLETCSMLIPEKERKVIIKDIGAALKSFESSKQLLAKELISVLSEQSS